MAIEEILWHRILRRHLEFITKSLPATAGSTFHARAASWGCRVGQAKSFPFKFLPMIHFRNELFPFADIHFHFFVMEIIHLLIFISCPWPEKSFHFHYGNESFSFADFHFHFLVMEIIHLLTFICWLRTGKVISFSLWKWIILITWKVIGCRESFPGPDMSFHKWHISITEHGKDFTGTTLHRPQKAYTPGWGGECEYE